MLAWLRDLASDSHTKGAAFRAFFEWCRKEYGEETARSVYADAPEELRQYLDPKDPNWGIVVSTWYPDRLVNRLLEVQFDPFQPNERLIAIRKATTYATEKTFNGIHRQFIRLLMTPAMYTRNVDRLWHLYYDTGTVTGDYAEGRIPFAVRDWRGHHPYRCQTVLYSTEEAFRMMGCRNLAVERTQCVSEGADSCGFLVTWNART